MIWLKNIAKVSDTFKKTENIFRHNGRDSISISIKKQSGTNIVKVVENIRKGLKELEYKLPDDYKVEVLYDQSEYVEKSISGVAESAVMGGILAFLVLYLFLKNFQNSMIVAVSIPVSLMGTFILMYIQKITINMMSLGGLSLGVGMLVDNSVVVLENIHRYNEMRPGQEQQNAIEGTNEVVGAITSSTLTTITVFLPFIFVSGVAGQLFKELAYTVTFSLITSLLVAITLIPRLSAGVKYKEFVEPGWSLAMKKYFHDTLNVFLKNKGVYIVTIAVFFILSTITIMSLDREFIPQTKQTDFMMKLEMLPGTPITITDHATQRIEQILKGIKEVHDITTTIGSIGDSSAKTSVSLMGPNQAEIMVKLKGKKGYSEYVIGKLKNMIVEKDIGGKIEYVAQAGVLGSALGGGAPISVEVKGESMDKLISLSKQVEKELTIIPATYGVKSTFKGYRPEIKIEVNKDRASLYDISTQNVTITAQTAIKGYVATKLKDKEKEVDIRVALTESDRASFDKIGSILVRSPLNVDVQLKQLAGFVETESSSEIKRKESQRIIVITSNYLGSSLSKILGKIKGRIKNLKDLTKEYTVEIAGEQEKMKESFRELMFVIILSLLFVYMIMASQFESLWQPFIVIFTVPLSAIGVAVFLLMTGTSLNVVVLLGITMLGGIVVNNGIVLISYFNILSGKEKNLDEIVVKASGTRLRPVLMTAMTTTLGLIPMAVAGGEGSELRSPLAITVIGGLLTSTFLTLYVIPAIYIIGEKFLSKSTTDKIKEILNRISW
jgi:HAE1 family hydrophobic/amphiphilic exporter-1